MARKKTSSDASSDATLEGFEFVDAGRTFTCEVEAPRPSRPERWWWFRVSPDVRDQRYAPFRASPDDTREDVRARIVSYYDELLARRAQPPSNNHWGQRRFGASGSQNAPAAPAATAATATQPPAAPDGEPRTD